MNNFVVNVFIKKKDAYARITLLDILHYDNYQIVILLCLNCFIF